MLRAFDRCVELLVKFIFLIAVVFMNYKILIPDLYYRISMKKVYAEIVQFENICHKDDNCVNGGQELDVHLSWDENGQTKTAIVHDASRSKETNANDFGKKMEGDTVFVLVSAGSAPYGYKPTSPLLIIFLIFLSAIYLFIVIMGGFRSDVQHRDGV